MAELEIFGWKDIKLYQPAKTEKTMNFSIDVESFYGNEDDGWTGEISFEVPRDFVVEWLYNNKDPEELCGVKRWTKKAVDDWRADVWLWEDANDILKAAHDAGKLVSVDHTR